MNKFILLLVCLGTIISLSSAQRKATKDKSTKKEVLKETLTDVDGNVYHTVKIGKQVWMVENLKVTRYRNGDPIQNVTDDTKWTNLTTGAYCNYNNDISKSNTYGRLYNWYAVTDSRKITPKGWHIPTEAEWDVLIKHLGGESAAGGRMKEAGFFHWVNPNTAATNETGLTALPGGFRDYENGTFSNISDYGYWWSSTEFSSCLAWYRYLYYGSGSVERYGNDKGVGFSVRCVRD